MKIQEIFNAKETFINNLNESIYIHSVHSAYMDKKSYHIIINNKRSMVLSYSELYNLINY